MIQSHTHKVPNITTVCMHNGKYCMEMRKISQFLLMFSAPYEGLCSWIQIISSHSALALDPLRASECTKFVLRRGGESLGELTTLPQTL